MTGGVVETGDYSAGHGSANLKRRERERGRHRPPGTRPQGEEDQAEVRRGGLDRRRRQGGGSEGRRRGANLKRGRQGRHRRGRQGRQRRGRQGRHRRGRQGRNRRGRQGRQRRGRQGGHWWWIEGRGCGQGRVVISTNDTAGFRVLGLRSLQVEANESR